MDKGILVIVAIGAAIIYFAMHFSGDDAMDDPDNISWSVSRKDNALAPYYEKDVLGNDVLNFTSISLEKAKSIWSTTPTAKNIAATLPDFDLARLEVENTIVQGSFLVFLKNYLDKLEGRFLAGELRSDQAQKVLLHFH